MKYQIFFDGSCEPNPKGFASIGVHIPELDIFFSQVLGEGEGMTSNFSEWNALIKGLEIIRDKVVDGDTVDIFGDSELVIKQISGQYQVKAKNLKPLYESAMNTIKILKSNNIQLCFQNIPREENLIADDLSHKPLRNHPDVKKYGMCSCGGIFVLREGKWGKFLGCSHYPKCRQTKQL